MQIKTAFCKLCTVLLLCFPAQDLFAQRELAPEQTSLCAVVAAPRNFADRRLELTALITSTKEGSFIWSS